MKTSLASSAASSASIKADHPQQLKSVTIYWRRRKMVLMQRPQRRLSILLCKMLRRSMQNLFGTLIGALAGNAKRAIGTAALATTALASMSAYAGITDITLPTNGTVQSGAATINTVGNQMTVTQATDKAIIDWQSFSIGSKAGVNFIQNNANSVALNRVTGNDPSLIMGSLTSNGKLFLVNAAGILVGKNAKIDVAGFVASTLNISNADFLAGRMNFAAEAGKHIGNVKNKGEITVHDGGSVYLIGANVENDGIINAPNGEVLLAAGRTVKLIDTTLPGVSIDVGGIAGKVTNLGRIMASAGTVGIGAALIDNSGTINASSVTKEGGRIFLRASQDLTTSSTSMINADGTVGGNVVLYSDKSANIDGDVSALGNVDGSGGKGGYVDTSGKTSLNVKYVPRVGPGGEWFIDPHNVEIVSDSVTPVGTTGTSAIMADGDNAKIRASTITGQLNTGVSVTVSTGMDGTQTGDITVSSAIVKNAGALATLTLDAAGSIAINDTISSTGGSGMNLVLNANNGSVSQSGSGPITVNTLTVTADSGITLGHSGNNVGTLIATNNGAGAVSFTNGSTGLTLGPVSNAGAITVTAGGSLTTTGAVASSSGTVNLTSYDALTVGVAGISAHDINLTTQHSADINLNGGLTATNQVSLNSNRAINQASGVNGIVAASLLATARGGISLLSLVNRVNSFSAANFTSGAITLVNNHGIPTGTLSLGDVQQLESSEPENITITNGGTITGTGAIDSAGGAVSVESVSGNIALQSLTAGAGAVTLTASAGNVSQTAGLTADSLTVNTGTGVTLTNGSNQIGSLTASSTAGDIVVASSGASTLTLNTITATAGNITVGNTSHDIQVGGPLTANGTGKGIALTAGGQISQSGNISTGQLAANAGTGIALTNESNQIGALTASSAAGDITVTTAGGAITLNNISATDGNIAINSNANDIHINGTLTANGTGKGIALTAHAGMLQTGGVISTGQLTVNAGIDIDIDSVGNNVHNFTGASETGHIHLHNTGNLATFGSITVGEGREVNLSTAGNLTVGGDGITAQTISLTATSPSTNLANIAIGSQLTANDAINLHTELGTITQSAAISAASLNASGTSDITLDNAGNNFASFTAGTSGDVAVKTAGALTLGSTSASNLTVTAGNGISMSGNIQASTGNVALTSTLGSITLGNVNAANLTVKADKGTVSQSLPTILTVSGELHAEAQNGITLNTNVSNQVGKFSASNSGEGNITFVNHSGADDVLTLGKIENIHGNVSITNNRAIVQTSGADTGISAMALNVVTSGGMTLNAANNVRAFTASNTGSGDIALTTLGPLTLSGNVVNSASTGNVTIVADGNIVSESNHYGGGGDVNRTASNGTVTLTSTSGNVTLGRIDAVDLAVNAHGLINQEESNTGGLTVTGTMNASASTGITLDHSSGTCGTNHIANFSATNSTSGDITFTNQSTGESVNNLVQITNNGGNILVDNTGAMKTTNLISAPHGSVTLRTHSPLTIGAGGINASTGVALTAGDGTGITDTIVVNGAIHNITGATAITGIHTTMNAPVFGPPPVFPGPNPPDYGSGYALNPATGGTSTAPPLFVVTTNTVDQNVASTSNISGNLTDLVAPTTNNQQNAAGVSSNQTIGGNPGEFGGSSNDDDGKENKAAKTNKPLPVCS
jgi:filamentous hemagglutinin family protein